MTKTAKSISRIELIKLLDWAELAPSNIEFWERVLLASQAYPLDVRIIRWLIW
jgi:hypothetical protein